MTTQIKAYSNHFLDLFDPSQDPEVVLPDLTSGEGPLWHKKDQRFYFNNIGACRTYAYSEAKGLRFAFNNGTFTSGMCADLNGRLLMCEQATSSLTVRNTDGTDRRVLADYYGDVELNSPTDVVQRSDGLIYFTDSVLGRGERASNVSRPYASPVRAVYSLNPFTMALSKADEGYENPNGLCFSPDERILYVGDMAFVIWQYDVNQEGVLENKRVFVQMQGPPDGMRVDAMGNLLVASLREGLNWYSPDGKLMGTICISHPQNLAWGESDFRTLLVTCKTCAYKFRTLVAGHDVTSLQVRKPVTQRSGGNAGDS